MTAPLPADRGRPKRGQCPREWQRIGDSFFHPSSGCQESIDHERECNRGWCGTVLGSSGAARAAGSGRAGREGQDDS